MTPGAPPLGAGPPATPVAATRRGSRRAPPVVWLPAVAVAAAMVTPPAYLLVTGWQGGADAWSVLADAGTWHLLLNTVALTVAVTAAAIGVGVPVAFLTLRTDMPGRRLLGVAAALPLVIPSFVGAYTLISALAPGGLVEGWLAAAGVTGAVLPSPYGFGGAFLSLTLFTYPYVLLTVRGALRGIDPALEESSRLLGFGPWRTFVAVTLPQLRPAIAAGGLLVALYVVSDFGAVSLARYSTFTRAIYLRYLSAFDRAPAAVLGLVLVALTALLLVLEARVARDRGGQFRRVHGTTSRPPPRLRLGRWRWPAAAACSGVVLVALVLPVTVLGWWLLRGLAAGEPLVVTVGAAGRSLAASLLGAGACVAAALPVSLWAVRHPNRLSRLTERAAFTGYALPGIVVALALVFFAIRVAEPLYQTLVMLVVAYVVLFLPQAIGAVRASLLQVPPNVEEAARTLGSRPMAALWRVVVPLARRGAVSGGALVFLTAMKELPATLLLSPIEYDTLAVRVWSATSEAFFARAAVPAVALLLLASVPLAVIVAREGRDRLA